MNLIRTLTVDDKFRPAHAMQKSLNGRDMLQTTTYRVTKVFPMSPYIVISVEHLGKNKGIFSLGPDTPVLRPREFNPEEEDVFKFIGVGKIARRKILGYRLLWDGKQPLTNLATPQAASALKLMFSVGKPWYTKKELQELMDGHFEQFFGRKISYPPFTLIIHYQRMLVDHGLIEVIDDVAAIPQEVVAADLRAAYEKFAK